MNCADIQLIVSQGPDVTDEEVSAFDAHVATCPACHAALFQLQSQADGFFNILGHSESYPPTATLNAIRSSLSAKEQVRHRPVGGQQMRRLMPITLAALVLLGLWCGGVRLIFRLADTQSITTAGGTATAIHPAVADDVSTPIHDGGLSPIATVMPTPTGSGENPLMESPTVDDPMSATSIVVVPSSPVPHLDDDPTMVLNPLPTITQPVVPTVEIPTVLPRTEVPGATVGTTPPPTVIAPTAITTPPLPPTAIATPPLPPTAIATPSLPPTAIATPPFPPTAIATPPFPPTAIATPIDPPTPIGPPTPSATSVPTATPTSAPSPLTPTPTISGHGLSAYKNMV